MGEIFRPYPAYRHSGIEWLGDVPDHWEVRRLKSVCSKFGLYGANVAATQYQEAGVRFLRTTDITDDGQLKDGGVFLSKELARGYVLTDGDVLISRSGTIGRSFLYESEIHGACSYAGYLVRFVPGSLILPKYVYLFTKTQAFEGFLRVMAILSTIENVNAEKYANAHLPVPPLDEQAAIVRYLDYVDRRVRRYVEAKRKLIALLEEERQAVIHQAVTRGLDPNVPLKPSGVEWLGNIPALWEAAQLGRIGRFLKGGGGTREDEVDEGLLCIRYGDIYTSYNFHLEHCSSYITRERSSDYTLLEHGDILFAGSGETIEDIGKSVVNVLEVEAYCGGDIILLRLRIEANPRYMGYLMDCYQSTNQKSCMGRGVTVMHIYSSQLKYMHIALPPISEQASIAKYLDKATANIDAAIARARRQIELLEEYRTRLIADVVTGKLDVRAAATGLPDEEDDELRCADGGPETSLDRGAGKVLEIFEETAT